MELGDLLQRREKLRKEAHDILEDHHERDGDQERWTDSEEKQKYDRRMEEVTDLTEQIQDLRAVRDAERDSVLDRENGDEPRGGRPEPDPSGNGIDERDLPPLFEGRDASDLDESERRARKVYRNYAPKFSSERGVDPETYAEAFRNYLSASGGRRDLPGEDQRALSAGDDEEGGFTVPPNFVARLIQAVDDRVYIRQRANVIPVTTGDSLGVPSLDADPADADWTTELGTGSEDTQMDFGKRELHPHPLAKRIKISRKLMRASALGVEALVRERMAYKFGVTQEKGFLTGTGAQQPLGLFTAAAEGISTSRDVSTDNTTTSVTFDGLKEAKWTLKSQYYANAEWIAHRDFAKQVDKIKDGNGQYIWQTSTQMGEPDRLLGFPVTLSEFAPNTFTTSNYVAILGDYSWYWIADALNMTMQRLVELYAEENQVGFIGRAEVDGMPALEEAFVRVQLA